MSGGGYLRTSGQLAATGMGMWVVVYVPPLGSVCVTPVESTAAPHRPQ